MKPATGKKVRKPGSSKDKPSSQRGSEVKKDAKDTLAKDAADKGEGEAGEGEESGFEFVELEEEDVEEPAGPPVDSRFIDEDFILLQEGGWEVNGLHLTIDGQLVSVQYLVLCWGSLRELTCCMRPLVQGWACGFEIIPEQWVLGIEGGELGGLFSIDGRIQPTAVLPVGPFVK